MKHIVFDGSHWRFADCDAKVRVLGIGDKVPEYAAGVEAATYTEAYEKLTGQPFEF